MSPEDHDIPREDDKMTATLLHHSPLAQAEHARQVVGVLSWLETRFLAGAWQRGARFGDGGGFCLIGGIDQATGWTQPGVAGTVTGELVARLPAPLRALGRIRPRLALALYNDAIGGRTGATQLVATTRSALGGSSPVGTRSDEHIRTIRPAEHAPAFAAGPL